MPDFRLTHVVGRELVCPPNSASLRESTTASSDVHLTVPGGTVVYRSEATVPNRSEPFHRSEPIPALAVGFS
jgi:hypothetical protein